MSFEVRNQAIEEQNGGMDLLDIAVGHWGTADSLHNPFCGIGVRRAGFSTIPFEVACDDRRTLANFAEIHRFAFGTEEKKTVESLK
jgi:hypothetical protein